MQVTLITTDEKKPLAIFFVLRELFEISRKIPVTEKGMYHYYYYYYYYYYLFFFCIIIFLFFLVGWVESREKLEEENK